MAGKGEYPPTSATLPFSASLNPPSHPQLKKNADSQFFAFCISPFLLPTFSSLIFGKSQSLLIPNPLFSGVSVPCTLKSIRREFSG